MDSKIKASIPIFNCKVKQDCNSIFLPVPYGALENVVRSLLSHNEGTSFEILSIGFLDD